MDFEKLAVIPTALTGRSARVSPQAILRANSNPVITPPRKFPPCAAVLRWLESRHLLATSK
ncbi:hypothetical protein DEO72_LG1g2534 [Vigna unguiculata]|uniref:Uncharacterized protein n=1 Tax=Vigna unguiculata TaxID=3917 RepID=A0A4D6KMN4_VIGUN|nr:hypothetical protein DEO72_LG1g2534 [Vigna unguiculata]